MGVTNTAAEKNAVALFCDTDMIAFGPVFDSETEADAFITYADEYHGVDDVRRLTPEALDEIHKSFVNHQAAEAEDE